MAKKVYSMGDFEKKVISCFHMARTFKQTTNFLQDELLKSVRTELVSSTPSGKRRYSNWMMGYVNGLIRANFYQIEQNEVEFCYEVEGVLYTTSKRKDSTKRKLRELMDEKKPTCQEMDSYTRGHYWFNTNKPYFVDSTNPLKDQLQGK